MAAVGQTWVEGQRCNRDNRMFCPEVLCSHFISEKKASETQQEFRHVQ